MVVFHARIVLQIFSIQTRKFRLHRSFAIHSGMTLVLNQSNHIFHRTIYHHIWENHICRRSKVNIYGTNIQFVLLVSFIDENWNLNRNYLIKIFFTCIFSVERLLNINPWWRLVYIIFTKKKYHNLEKRKNRNWKKKNRKKWINLILMKLHNENVVLFFFYFIFILS